MKTPKRKHLWSIAIAVLTETPALSDAEWKAEIKQRLADQRWGNPPLELLSTVLTQIDRMLAKRGQARPLLPVGSPTHADSWPAAAGDPPRPDQLRVVFQRRQLPQADARTTPRTWAHLSECRGGLPKKWPK